MAIKTIGLVAAPPILLLLAAAALGGGGSSPAPGGASPGNPGPLVTNAVPAQYRDLVVGAGQVCAEITSPLIAAQIEAESAWNPNAGSSVGAQGIAQFMPQTWKTYGKDYNHNGVNSPYDPGDAIPAQSHLMCDLVGQMKGAAAKGQVKGDLVSLALAGYNAGPFAVLEAGGIPPITETQDYVTKITSLVDKYTTAGNTPGPGTGPTTGDGGRPGVALPPQPCSLPDWTQPTMTQYNGHPYCLTPRMDKLARKLHSDGYGNGTVLGGGFYCWDWHAINPTSDHRRGAACDLPYGPGFATGKNLQDGWRAANWIVAHAAEYGVHHVLWQGLVWDYREPRWVPYDGGGVYDPTSPGGGHYDHVHVSVF